MFRKLGGPSLVAALSLLFAVQPAQAQSAGVGRQSRPRINRNIDEGHVVTLPGNTHPDARKAHDLGKVDDAHPMRHLLLQLRRSPEQEQVVQKFIDALHDPASPQFHNWITAEEFGDRFGVAEQDLDTVTRWLISHGFTVNVVYPSGMVIDFSGTAEQVNRAFGTEIHHLEVGGEKHTGNMSDPKIPAALASVVVGVVSLHDFRPRAMHVMRNTHPKFTFNGLYGDTYALVPGDLATIYNLNPLFNAGFSGQGQTIALIEDTNVFSSADWTAFRSKFGLSAYKSGSFKTVHPAPPGGHNNCTNPGVIAPNDAEAILDAEWASASAPSAAVEIASCADTTTTFGGLIAIQNLINSSTPPSIMSVSYGQCETVNGAAANAAYNSVYQQAVAEGISIFVAAGDSGASGCDNNVSEATHGIGANAFASTPYNVAVGGTDFSDTFSGTNSSYWSASNTSSFASAQSYIPEIPWNNSCAGELLANYLGYASTYGPSSLCNDPSYGPYTQTTVAGGGSPSGCATGAPSVSGVVSGTCQGWPKPSWQSVLGNPNDGVRDTPDVSLFAADGLWSHYYVFCWSDRVNGGAACTGDPSGWSGAGGTSFSSPIMAGIQALVNQKMNARQGNPNPVYYQLAAAEFGSGGTISCNSSLGLGVAGNCVFYDVTQGDMDVNCTGTANCYAPSGPGTQGVLSTSNSSFQPAYGTTAGWDFATGIGSLNATNLVSNWPGGGPIPGFSLSVSPASLTLTQGSSGASTITITPQNGFSSSVSLAASGLPAGVTASFSPATTTSTSTLTLTASSSAAIGVASVTITGTSNFLSSSATISLTVNSPGSFSLSASPASLSFYQAASGTSTITVTPLNGFDGSVSLSATGLPSGVSASFNPSSTAGTSTLTLSASLAAAVGTFNLTINGVSGSLTGSTSVAVTILSAALPSGWSDLDIGAVGPAGNASFANGTFTVNSSGQFIWNTADGFNFAYQPWSGDAIFVARLVSMQGGSSSQSSGIMIRESFAPGSTNVYEAFGSSSLIYFDERSTTGGNTASQSTPSAVALPYWVKLVRSGNTFTGFTSPDGVNWTQVGTSQTVNMAANVFVGFAVASDDITRLTSATFDNVSITAPPVSFTLSAAPASLSIAQGASGTSTITVTPQNGFSGSVNLSATGLPSGVTASFNPTSTTGTSTLTLTASSAAGTGTFTVTITGSSGTLMNTTPVSLTVTAVSGSPLPSGWSNTDVGSVGLAGSSSYSNGTFTVNGSGTQIWDTADGFQFAYQSLSGDGTIIARLVNLQGGSPVESAGLMVRETLTAGSTNVYTALGQQSLIYFDERAASGGTTASQSSGSSVVVPIWLKLVRSGNTFSGYLSHDGVSWTQVGTNQTFTMAANVFIGLAVNSASNSALATANFDNVSITSNPAPALPAPWLSQDVGPVSLTGSASYSNGTFTVSGSGAQVWDVTDSFQYVYQPLAGDGTIVARLVGLHGGSTVESAGLMVRETLTAGSTNVYTALGQQSLIYFDDRATTGGISSSQNSGSAVAAPIWLKLVRSGNTFTGFLSTDGMNWTQVGAPQTVIMASNVYIGLAVNAASNSALATATFDNVAKTP